MREAADIAAYDTAAYAGPFSSGPMTRYAVPGVLEKLEQDACYK